MIAEWAVAYTAAELDRVLNEAGVVCAPVYSVADILADDYFHERELLTEIEDEVHGRETVPAVIPKLSDTRRGSRLKR
jgi:crotonobetainyl-CoA:carnitine CoA-transferase CaiB-like acyl-CoA transferase